MVFIVISAHSHVSSLAAQDNSIKGAIDEFQTPEQTIQQQVTRIIAPLMQKYDVPGMAVGIIQHGKVYESYFRVKYLKPADDNT